MGGVYPFSRLVRGVLAFLLAVGLVPALAYAEETRSGKSIVEQFDESRAEEIERFATTGSLNDLRDVNAYDGDGAAGVMLLLDNLPGTYDLRDEGVVTPVKNQSPWGTCWGFGAIAASETSIMSELGLTVDDGEVDLSELHTAWFSYTPLPEDAGSQAGEGNHTVSTDPSIVLNQGGLPFTATSVFSSGIGPVSEIDVPYKNAEGITVDDAQGNPIHYSSEGDWSVDEDLRFAQAIELEHSSILPSPAGRGEDGSYEYHEAGTEAIKWELVVGHAVEIAFCADTSRPGQEEPAKYINTDTWAHYTYDDSASANHAVTIIGWDDDYLASNFLQEHQPEQNGAWIVKNSWGASDVEFPNWNPGGWGVDGTGYFYLSYYDKSLMVPESFDYYTEEYGQAADYYLIDQYDYMPSNGVTSGQSDTLASMANVFEADEHQRVRSLSSETASPNTEVVYELYLLNENYSNPRDGELLVSKTETYQYGGYHRIQLGAGFPIEQGQHYSVVATQRYGSEYEILVDKALNKAGMDYVNEQYPDRDYSRYAVGIVNRGESFLFENGAWTDWADSVAELKQQAAATAEGDIYDYDNFAIKAYADPIPDPPIHETVIVPDLGNMTEAEALFALEQIGLGGQAGAAEYSTTVAVGRVVRQDIGAGTEVDKGSLVTYHLSLGPEGDVSNNLRQSSGDVHGAGKGLISTGDDALWVIMPIVVTILVCAAVATISVRLGKFREGRRP